MTNTLRVVQPAGWPRPHGYANGMAGRGEVLFIAGQIGWSRDRVIVGDDFVEQFSQALANVIAVLNAAGGRPEHIARMTVYVTDLDAYRASAIAIGAAWKAAMGTHYPAMALVGVAGLVEPRAKVEIEATAVLPE